MMPTHERRYYLSLLKGIKEDAEENKANQSQIISNGKGTKTTKIGGQSLVNMIRDGKLPNL